MEFLSKIAKGRVHSLINVMENILTAGAMDTVSYICVKLNQDVALKSIPKRSTSKIFDIFLLLNKAALFIEDTVKGCACVWECTQAKAIWGDYKTHPQPELLICFHGEFESALKNWLRPVIKGGGHICLTGQRWWWWWAPFFPCASFSWQWLNEFVVKEGGLEWQEKRILLFSPYVCHSRQPLELEPEPW